MDFIDQLKQFSTRIAKMKDSIQTEEATKTSMILPFFQMLGYDIFNPLEFVPEYTADVGIKKGEKVDYAIMGEDQRPLILIEAKCHDEDLNKHGSQLFKYFSTTPAKFGILTNGIIYRFYTDLEEKNKMDDRPFLELNLLDIKDSLVAELKKFQKTAFDLDTILTTASELKYNSQIKQFLAKQLESPSDEFVTYILNNVYDGRKTQKIIDEFRDTVKKSFVQFINEQVNDRLKTALGSEDSTPATDGAVSDKEDTPAEPVSRIVTTQEEIEAFFIIKALVHDCLGEHDITHKDTETYFGILLDNNTRKWICRLQLDGKKKLILPDSNKKYVAFTLESLNDLYGYKDALKNVIKRYTEPAQNSTGSE
ncbi:MAG: type I restriction endonuclease [Negativicutes bacterium]